MLLGLGGDLVMTFTVGIFRFGKQTID